MQPSTDNSGVVLMLLIGLTIFVIGDAILGTEIVSRLLALFR